MLGRLILTNSLCVLFPLITLSQTQLDSLNQGEQMISRLQRKDLVKAEFFEEVYQHYNLEHFLDNYYQYGHYQIETTADFGQPDFYTFSLTGYSYKWNRYYYRGHRFNDLYFPGSSLYKPYLYDTDIGIDMVQSTVQFHKHRRQGNRVNVEYANGHMGNEVPWATWWTDFTLGHTTGREGEFPDFPADLRKRIGQTGKVYFDLGKEHRHSGYLYFGNREITNFAFDGVENLSDETNVSLFFEGELPNPVKGVFDHLYYMAGYTHRDELFAEFLYDETETANYDAYNFSLYGEKRSDDAVFHSGVNFSFKNIQHNELNFSRNWVDQDGEGFEPWYPDARVTEISFSNGFEQDIQPVKGLSLVFDSYNAVIQHNASTRDFHNSLYFESVDNPYTPLYGIEWTAQDFTTGLLENTLGLRYSKPLGEKSHISAGADITFDGFLISDESFTRVSSQFDLKFSNELFRNFGWSLNIGKRRVPFDYDWVRFLSDDYLSGTVHFWNDPNNDRIYDPDENSGVFYQTGGAARRMDKDNLKQPQIYYVDADLNYRLGDWYFGTLFQYRSFRQQWHVDYSRPAEEIGEFSSIIENDQPVYFLNPNQDFDFLVVPYRTALFEQEQGAGKELGTLWDHPFYGGTTINIQHEKPRVFFNISFTAYMVVGFGSFGNGVLHNNVGVLSESLADPNLYIRYLGRLDSDRAYIVRGLFSYRITDHFSTTLRVKYKDGQPVNLFDTEFRSQGNNTQVAMYNTTTKGTDPFGGPFGFRESGFWNMDLAFRYRVNLNDHPLTVSMEWYNIMDVASTLNNVNFSPGAPDERFTLETMIPRGLGISLDYQF
jgi:hypothetical protein